MNTCASFKWPFLSATCLGSISLFFSLLCCTAASADSAQRVAQVSILDITATSAFALRCRDLSITSPYSRGFVQWTSTKVAGNPPAPSFTMTVAIMRYDGVVYREVTPPSIKTLTAYNGQFPVEARSPVLTGQFRGYMTVFTSGVKYSGPTLDKYDIAVC
jgi:hypothetical protein